MKTTTIHFGTVSSAETEQHQDVVSRKEHLWLIHGLGLDQHVSNKMDAAYEKHTKNSRSVEKKTSIHLTPKPAQRRKRVSKTPAAEQAG